jgi:membrane-bound ClpP family serine protease
MEAFLFSVGVLGLLFTKLFVIGYSCISQNTFILGIFCYSRFYSTPLIFTRFSLFPSKTLQNVAI